MKKIFVLVIALVAILSSCSNPVSGSFEITPTPTPTPEPKPTEEDPRKYPPENKVTLVDFNEDLSNYKECKPDKDTGVNWVYINKFVWEKYFEGQQEERAYYLKPVLKVESSENGITFFHNETGVKGSEISCYPREGVSIVRDEWAYKCVIYIKNRAWANYSSSGSAVQSSFYRYRNSKDYTAGYGLGFRYNEYAIDAFTHSSYTDFPW